MNPSFIFIVDWRSSKAEGDDDVCGYPLEFSWVVYDVERHAAIASVQRWASSDTEEGADGVAGRRPVTKALEDVVNEFDAALLKRRDERSRPVCLVNMDRTSLRSVLEPAAAKSGLELGVHYSQLIELKHILTRHYCDVSADVLSDPFSAAAKLTGSPCENTGTALSRCEAMTHIVRHLTQEGVAIAPLGFGLAVGEADGTVAQHYDQSYGMHAADGTMQLAGHSSMVPVGFACRLRGLPWETSVKDIIDFVKAAAVIEPANVQLITRPDGRSTGEAHIELPTAEERDNCVATLHGKSIGSRWIEVFKTEPEEGVLRLRGLPWTTTPSEIARFFMEGGIPVSPEDVTIATLPDRRMTGDAWVVVVSKQVAEAAVKRLNKGTIGRRYIEMFVSSKAEMCGALMDTSSYHTARFVPQQMPMAQKYEAPRYAPYGVPAARPMGMERAYGGARAIPEPVFGFTVVRLRGLPFNCNENGIGEFFSGYAMEAILPSLTGANGRPSGEAYVKFASPVDAHRAVKERHGAMIERRYIELFPSTPEEMEAAAMRMRV